MTNWHERFFALADLVGSWSKDPSTKVGAVIVRPNRTIASVGYNGFPRGVEDKYTTREAKLLRTVHAEANAILTANGDVRGCTLYVTPLHPCANCAGLIIQAGISKVYFKLGPRADAWADHYDAMWEMFESSGVKHYQYMGDK